MPAGPLAVSVPRLVVTATPLTAGRFRLAAPAPFTAVGGGAFTVTGRLTDGAVTVTGDRPAGRVAVEEVRITQPGAPPVTSPARPPPGPPPAMVTGESPSSASGLKGLGAAADMAAETAAEIRVSGRLSGPLAGANAVDWAEWRDAGGVLETDEIAVAWADVRLSGDGSWTLDKALRPAGAGRFDGDRSAGLDRSLGGGRPCDSETRGARASRRRCPWRRHQRRGHLAG